MGIPVILWDFKPTTVGIEWGYMGTYVLYYERCDMDFVSTWDEALNANSGEMAIANPLLDLWAHCWTKSGWCFGK